jgi:hypothetical protein
LSNCKDELRTGVDGTKVTFRDDTVLTLGEKASIIIDRYVYDPDQNVGETVLQATKGALHFVSGRIKGLKQKRLPSPRWSPTSACAVASSGAARLINMGCWC